jgi:hypothetical protein
MGFDSPAETTRVIVAPCAATVEWAKGRVPHPLGDVDVAWERRGDALHVAVTALKCAAGGIAAAIRARADRQGVRARSAPPAAGRGHALGSRGPQERGLESTPVARSSRAFPK